ncbi:hypothetical protein RB195_003517 [Necator americanus]|uniref:SXP/RAL-2 family protein Ani s 5-like cation-binding domain-containing protein n=1 Tax=Necator americanus TaxID=51031 RepID=A0ABR1DQG1_NECAM
MVEAKELVDIYNLSEPHGLGDKMSSKAALLIVCTVIFEAQTQCCNPNPNPEYSTLLYGAPRDARRALRRTLRNSNSMPRKQLKERVEQWAVHYNKTEQLTAVLNKSAAASQTIQKNIHMIFEQLPEFMAKLTAISANMELSVEGMSNSIEELNKSVNQTLADAACCIVSTTGFPGGNLTVISPSCARISIVDRLKIFFKMLNFCVAAFAAFSILQKAEACCWCSSQAQHVFVQTTSHSAQQALQTILTNSYSKPRDQVTASMAEWATQNNMTGEFEDFQRRSQQIAAETENSISEILNQLPAFISNIYDIRNNQSLSQEEADRMTRTLYDSASRNLANAACCILSQMDRNVGSFTFTYSVGPATQPVTKWVSGWMFRGKRSLPYKATETAMKQPYSNKAHPVGV